jgi:hypothetical protein
MTPDTELPDQDDDKDLYVDRPLPHTFSDAVREAPLTAIAAAFVAGLLMSRLVF